MDRVKELLAAGLPLPDAVKTALRERGLSVAGLADKYDFARSITSEQINLDRTPRDEFCAALATELGGRPEDWALLLWQAAKPALAA